MIAPPARMTRMAMTTTTSMSVKPRRRGFTLIEVVVVMAILVILAGGAIMVYQRILEDSRRDTSYHKMKQLEEAAEIYYSRNGQFPPNFDEFVSPSDGR